MKPQVSPLFAGIVAAAVMSVAMQFGRRSGLLRRRPPDEITNQLLASAGSTNATRGQLADPRLHFRWLDAGGSISRPRERLLAVPKPQGKGAVSKDGGLK